MPCLSKQIGAALCLSVSLFAQTASVRNDSFQTSVQPFLSKNCYACHNAKLQSGEVDLQSDIAASAVTANRDKWETVVRKLQTGEMPPKGAPRPDPANLKEVTSWIQEQFARADAALKPEPGRVTARRLNRSEYNNTIRDLLAVNIKPADDFPQDDSGYGFDNIGDVLSLSPVLMEKYLSAAEKVVRTAMLGPGAVKPTVVRHQPPYRPGTDGGDNSRFAESLPFTITDYDQTGLSLPSALHTTQRFPASGNYVFRISPEGNRPRPSDPFTVAVWIDGKQTGSVQFEASASATSMEGEDKLVTIRVPGGDHWVAISALKLYDGLPEKYHGLKPTSRPPPPPQDFSEFFKPKPGATPEEIAEMEKKKAAFLGRKAKPPLITDVSFRVNFVEISGPFEADTAPSAESRKKVFTCGHLDGKHEAGCARTILSSFARRAYRRPPTAAETGRLLKLVAEDQTRGDSFEQAIGVALQAILVSPQFLFRIERDDTSQQSGSSHPISPFELASRLSYFLWSSMPDEELLRCAEQKTLQKPEVLTAQIRRMLRDPKSHALVENFGGQWLEFRALESVRPDINRFGAFDKYVRMSLQKETELFFEHIMREDRSILDFLNAKYTFLNEELAQFYGIKGVSGPEFRKVDLTGTPRAGVLTQGSVLTVSSYPNRTSVVLRGKWVLENLLNAPVPPPPPNVPALDEAAVGTAMSLREQMEKHRSNAVCASCHSRMDPIGFGLENFDAIGQWRTKDGKFAIDATGTLPDGKSFNGPVQLIEWLNQQPDSFAQCITEKMLTYALGRGLERYDRPVVKTIGSRLAQDNYRFSRLVLEIVNSLPFQERSPQPAGRSTKQATDSKDLAVREFVKRGANVRKS